MEQYHEPVLLNEAVSALQIKPQGIYIDVTYGGGGHSKEIIKHLKPGRLIAFDQDADAIVNKVADDKLTLIHDNFDSLEQHLQELNCIPVQGILADLGISSHHINSAERGFSTRFDAVLDMRMNQQQSLTARDVVNEYSEKNLVNVFSTFGEIRNSKSLASTIISARDVKEIVTTGDLKSVIKSCIPFNKEHQYLAQVFQALRIEVNGEMDALKNLLEQSVRVLDKDGRLVVISYHSLEDRMVKNMMQTGNTNGEVVKDIYGNTVGAKFRVISKKAITPGEDELKRNPRSRSAKMRVAEKL
ncbi:MAG: 16S rRNA (cytosine(1402)-N(4))-methyltransferase RsmH [Bacteroidota bacterium]